MGQMNAAELFKEHPEIERALKVMTAMFEARDDRSQPLSMEYGYRRSDTLEHCAIKITVEDSTRDVSEFGEVIDKKGLEEATKGKENNGWGIGI